MTDVLFWGMKTLPLLVRSAAGYYLGLVAPSTTYTDLIGICSSLASKGATVERKKAQTKRSNVCPIGLSQFLKRFISFAHALFWNYDSWNSTIEVQVKNLIVCMLYSPSKFSNNSLKNLPTIKKTNNMSWIMSTMTDCKKYSHNLSKNFLNLVATIAYSLWNPNDH